MVPTSHPDSELAPADLGFLCINVPDGNLNSFLLSTGVGRNPALVAQGLAFVSLASVPSY